MSRKLKRTSLFAKDVSSLLYAYGDIPNPLPSTVACLDELVSFYLVDVCENANRISKNSRALHKSRIKLDDFRFVLRKDPVKLGRADELISTNKLITEAKKQFNETDTSLVKTRKLTEQKEKNAANKKGAISSFDENAEDDGNEHEAFTEHTNENEEDAHEEEEEEEEES